MELVEPCLLFATSEGDLVLEPFLGSGTTAVAAACLNRCFCGVELNLDYFQFALDRLCAEGLISKERLNEQNYDSVCC